MRLHTLSSLLLFVTLASAQERPVPPPGVEVPDADRKELEAGLDRLKKGIEDLRLRMDARIALLPDVEIFHEAVRYALQYGEFLKPEEIHRGKELLRTGQERIGALAAGHAPWSETTGLTVRGYISKIDGSVQPYGLVIPPTWTPSAPRQWRLDAWFHGRQENLTELNFLWERLRIPGQFTPQDTIVLHLYGRYCNANKFAGEVDLFEALDAVQRQYRIDPDRITVRGFSMGGAAVWQFATHYAGLWAAAAPGAGFAETAEFLRLRRTGATWNWWEEKLWRMYDATEYAANLFNLPVVAYSGENDRQKQAADIMAEAMRKERLRLAHIIGPGMGHRYHPDSRIEIDRRLDAIVARGRDAYPPKVRFTTFTLAYNRMKWVQVNAMERHWERARVDAEIAGPSAVSVKTAGVAGFSLDFGAGGCPLDPGSRVRVTINGQTVETDGPESDLSWTVHVRRTGDKWAAAGTADEPGLHKRHRLQGPIDDAFLDRFVIVRPTGKPMHEAAAKWVQAEMERAIREWRRHFRGEAVVKSDTEITDGDIRDANLVLWGDPSSNRVLAKLAVQLPVRWNAEAVSLGQERFPGGTTLPLLIYPNPLNPSRYVVLNSGFTFREFDYLNNARQVPKLPDYAVVDITAPPDSRWPGKIAAAGFFDERWQLQANHGR